MRSLNFSMKKLLLYNAIILIKRKKILKSGIQPSRRYQRFLPSSRKPLQCRNKNVGYKFYRWDCPLKPNCLPSHPRYFLSPNSQKSQLPHLRISGPFGLNRGLTLKFTVGKFIKIHECYVNYDNLALKVLKIIIYNK